MCKNALGVISKGVNYYIKVIGEVPRLMAFRFDSALEEYAIFISYFG